MADSRVQILIEQTKKGTAAKDTASDLKSLDQAAKQVSGGLSGIAGVAGGAGLLALGGAALNTTIEFGKAAAAALDMRAVFDDMAQQAGESGEQMLSAMQRASSGMVSDAALVGSANRAMLLGVANSSQEMAQLLDVARVRGQAMGLSLEEAFGDVVTGIGRLSPMILDNLGIALDLQAVYDEYAQSLGRTSASLGEAEKKQALLNKVIADTAPLIASSVSAGDDNMASFEKLAASAENAKIALGELALSAGLPEFLDVVNQSLKDSVEQLQTFAAVTGAIQAGDFEKLGDIFGGTEGAQEGLFEAGNQLTQKSQELRNAISDFQDAAISGDTDNIVETGLQMKNLDLEVQQLGERYNELASITKAPLLDLSQLQLGVIAYRDAATGISHLSDAQKAAEAEAAGWNAILSESPAVVRQWAIELQAAGVSLDEVKGKIEGSKEAFKEIQEAQDQALSGLFEAGGKQVDVLGLDKVLESVEPAAQKIKVAVANLFQDFASGDIGADELSVRLAALGDEADSLADDLTTAGQETEQFTAAMMQSPAVLAGLQAAAAAAGIPLDQLIARLGDTKAALLDLIGAAGGASSRIFSSVAGVADIVGDEAAFAAGEAALKSYNSRAEQLAAQLADNSIGTDRYNFEMAMLSDGMDDYAEGVNEAERESKRLASTLAGDAKKAANEAAKAFDDLKSKVSGVLSDAMGDVRGVNPDEILEKMGFHEDTINENAARLADIAMNGFKDQDWLGEFAAEVPDIFKALEEAGDPRAAAANMLKEFQAGFRPELLDKDLLKQAVKDMIASDQAKEALATEIASELAAEMGTAMPDALAAAREALGAKGGEAGTVGAPAFDTTASQESGSVAGVAFGGAFSSSMSEAGTKAIARLGEVLKAEENLKLIGSAGLASGKRWGTDFLASVSENVPQGLIDLLVNLVTPGVGAKQRQAASMTGASG